MVRNNRIFWMSWLLLLPAILLNCLAAAPVSSLTPDPDFGTNGLVLTDFSTGSAEATALALQTDGKIVVAGAIDNGIDRDLLVVRYLPDGSIDPTFSFTLGNTIGAGFGDDIIRGVTIADDGTILLAGRLIEQDQTAAVLLKLLPDGRVDYRFGDQGVLVVHADDNRAVEVHAFLLLPDGAIMVAGSIGVDQAQSPLVARFLADGTPDVAFGTAGLLLFQQWRGGLQGMALSATGEVLVCGYAFDENDRRGLLVGRLAGVEPTAPSGTADFVTYVHEREETIAHAVAVDHHGLVVIAGETIGPDGRRSALLGRLSADRSGSLYLEEQNLQVHDVGDDSAAYAIAVAPDNTVLAAGYRMTADDTAAIILIMADGLAEMQPDDPVRDSVSDTAPAGIFQTAAASAPAQGVDDETSPTLAAAATVLVTNTLPGSEQVSRAIAVSADGTVYTAGTSSSGDHSSLLLAAYASTDPEGNVATTAAQPVFSDYYAIKTVPVTGITRGGGTTGGEITPLVTVPPDCQVTCEAGCTGTEEEIAECLSACQLSCSIPTIDRRGVVYATSANPVLDEMDDEGAVEQETSDTNPFAVASFFDLDSYLVKKGHTEDGSGAGAWNTQIEDANPQTVYYVRAYAVLSDGLVLYGNEVRFETKDACFIATAVFGSEHGFAVQTLRLFRDRYLLTSNRGRAAVASYYRWSPAIASLVERAPPVRAVLLAVLLPVVAGAAFMVYIPIGLLLIPAGLVAFFSFHRLCIGTAHD